MTPASPTSGKRSDATRNVEAILDASVGVLTRRPDASMSEIAQASGVSRQTVYAHFPSREVLLGAVADRALDRALTAIDQALDTDGDAKEKLTRLIPAWWETVGEHAAILDVLGDEVAMADGKAIRQFHDPIIERLDDLATQGQSEGLFDARVSSGWLASAFLGLVHTGAAEVAQGRMRPAQVLAALEVSIPQIFGFHAEAPKA